ncbi:hypothetical protein [Kosakonia oryzae]|uniref:hypothetical protein n=1 Tax=Kosakonia oryzae TaxID=497725 RepID=UPI001D098BA2|nr:hypothetical protein [Kosakonia oryzae]UDJ82088.1 response regulator transcription factor [Kosakonia oryzae]
MPDLNNDVVFLFDRVLVMDRAHLTGLALCNLADSVAHRPCSEYVADLSALQAAVSCAGQERLLLITELMSAGSTVRDGVTLLQALQPLQQTGQCRVMVCTDLADPLLLRAILSAHPSVLALRREALVVLQEAIRMADVDWPGTVLSPAVTEELARVQEVKLAPREMEMLVTQVDHPDLRALAQVMNVSHKTVSAWRLNVMRQMTVSRKSSFRWRLAQLQKITGRR